MEPGDGIAGDSAESPDGTDAEGGGSEAGLRRDGGATKYRGGDDGTAGTQGAHLLGGS